MVVNKERVNALFKELAEFGKDGTGVSRLAYSPEDLAAHAYIIQKFEDLGLKVTRDAVGNIFARREGLNDSLPVVATGSHLDSVSPGGAYDGVAGVVSALEALTLLKDEQLSHPIELIVFMAEESTRFGFATIGSKLIAGIGSPESFSKSAKEGQKSYCELLTELGFKPQEYKSVQRSPEQFKSFVELHIEQGKILDQAEESIGIVENIAAPTRIRITVEGLADHSGATPMGHRRDALVSAAKLILAVEKVATNEAHNGTVGTVGVMDVYPGSITVVPGKVVLLVDIRGVDTQSIIDTVQNLKDEVSNVAEEDDVSITIDMVTADKPVALSNKLADELEDICKSKSIAYRRMNSGAGHDAMHMATLTPTTMIFIPCKDGISHNPEEYAKIDDIAIGIDVLTMFLKQQAK